MSNDFIDDDSLDLDLSDANHTSQLYNLNQRLLFKGYNSILDETGELNQKTLEETLDKLLQRDSQLLKLMDETREDLQRSEIEVKKYLQKSEVLENENEMKDRKIGLGLQRESKLMKRCDELEKKLKEKTEVSRQLTLKLKNTEAKFKIDKRKLEMEISKLKEKMNVIQRGAGGSKKSQRLNGVINITGQKEFEVSFMAESTRIMTSASNVASGLENNNRDLIDKNVQLKGALANTYSKVIETLRSFPNYEAGEIDQYVIDMAEMNPGKLVSEVARNCNQLEELVNTLEDFQTKRLAELEKDLEARQEKIMVTKVAEIENDLAEVKKNQEEHQTLSSETLFQKMNELIQDTYSSDEDDNNEIDDPEAMEPTEAKMSTPDAYKRLLSKSDRRSSAHNTPLQKVLIERMCQSPGPGGDSPLAKPAILFPKFENDSLMDE